MVDILIGIPSYNEADSITHVIQTIDRGLSIFFPMHTAMIVNADSESEDSTTEVFLSTETRTSKISLNGGKTPRGKGINLLRIFDYAAIKNATCIAIFDADVVSIEVDWIDKMVRPIIENNVDLVTPIYKRNRYEGNTTNHIAYPYLFGIFRKHIRQPIAGDFALSRTLYQYLLTVPHMSSTLRYGIDIFITFNALAKQLKIHQIYLSKKIHKPGFPKIIFMSNQVIDTLFHLVLKNKHIRITAEKKINFLPASTVDSHISFPDTLLIADVKSHIHSYLKNNQDTLSYFFPILDNKFFERQSYKISAEHWPTILSNAYIQLEPKNHSQIRDALAVLYLCRVFGFWDEIKDRRPDEIEHIINIQALQLRKLLVDYCLK